MAFALPACPPAAEYDIRLDTLRAENSPPLGGPDSRVPRLGSRHICDVLLENMTAAQAMIWQNRLMAEDETVVWPIPTRGLVIGNPGTPQVNGAGQTGSTLSIKGLPAGYVVQENQYLPVQTAGRVYLYKARGPATANGSGIASVPLNCIIRVPHANNDTILMAVPVIEGFVVAGSVSGLGIKRRRLNNQGLVEGVRFTIREVR